MPTKENQITQLNDIVALAEQVLTIAAAVTAPKSILFICLPNGTILAQNENASFLSAPDKNFRESTNVLKLITDSTPALTDVWNTLPAFLPVNGFLRVKINTAPASSYTYQVSSLFLEGQEFKILRLNLAAPNSEKQTYQLDKSIAAAPSPEKADKELKISDAEEKYVALFENIQDAVLLLKNKLIVACNQAAAALFNSAKKELINAPLWKFLPTQYTGVFSGEHQTRQTKAYAIIEKELVPGQTEKIDWKILQPDGSEMDLEITVLVTFLNNQSYRQIIIRNVTATKQAVASPDREVIWHESVKHFRDFLGRIEMAYISLDVEGTITYVNNYFLEYTNYNREEVIGLNFFDAFVPEPEREERRQNFFEMIRSKIITSYNERDIETKSGMVKTLRWQRMFDFDPDGRVIGVTHLGRDVTDKKIAMEALKDNKSRLQDILIMPTI
ncbi:PAS domain-containing protein [Adhaeribacter pallidiroseus]|uniref:PAS domain S-box protein n=1 Tax=Adhaeribacter pallidiroseus TaxID=2072847 RepID=A0A369QGZ9_9BACT|nr:PAS domain-containing protein [Adhaeribacter pallidiroseus]RDC64181.1 hypothetical protein AHMF7616_02792 [Adhaeribacter pallidiroseus]